MLNGCTVIKTEQSNGLTGVANVKSSVKLKASDIYSDDSGSDSEDKHSGKRSSSSSRSSSDSEEETPSEVVTGKKHTYMSVKNVYMYIYYFEIFYSEKTCIYHNKRRAEQVANIQA